MSGDNKLPRGWMETTLGEVAKTNLSSIDQKYEYNNILYLDTGSITKGKIESLQHYKLQDAPSRARRLVKNNDIVYSTVRPNLEHYGFIENPEKNIVVSTGFTVITANRVNSKYLYYYLTQQNITNFLHTLAEQGTSTYPSIRAIDLENINLSVPGNIEEQKTIANILTTFDDKIELLQAQNDTLETIAQTIFKEWFGKYQVGDELPEGWRIGELGDVAYNHSKSFKFTNENVVFINTGDVLEGQFLHFDKISPHGLPGQAKKAIEMYDILYSEIRPKNKRFAFVDFTVDDYVVSTKFMIIRPIDDFSPFILYLILKSQSTINEFNTVAESRSGTFPQITFESIKNFPIVIPNSKAQSDFEKNLIPIMDKKKINHQQIQTLQQTRDTLLPKLMSGKVRVDEFKE